MLALSRESGYAVAMIRAFVLLLVLASACGDDGGVVDAPQTVDIDNGSCGDTVRFTGELVDWDQDQGFCGIFDALFQVQGDGAMDTTAPNGRFDMCVPDQPETLVDVTPSANASACAQIGGTYPLPAIAVANKAVIFAGAFWSGRLFTMPRETVDAAKAQVVVHVEGTPRAVSLSATHGETQAIATDVWAVGDTGHEVFFRDVDPAGETTTLSVAGGAIGAGAIPLTAGKVTLVTVVAN